MTGLMIAAVLAVALPLVAVVWAVFARGLRVAVQDFPAFFVKEIPVVARRAGPGMGPAILGTLLATGAATLIAVPLGVLGAVYLHEYGGTQPVFPPGALHGHRDDRRSVDRDGPVRLRRRGRCTSATPRSVGRWRWPA